MKHKFKDSVGRYLTQSLFLEAGYDTDTAVFTFNGEDKLYKCKTYISLKKCFVDMEDPTEYLFASKYLYNWEHWQKMLKNKMLLGHIEQWREELKLSLTAQGIKNLIDIASQETGSYQAAKWLADSGFLDKKRGRPSKEEVKKHLKKEQLKAEEDTPDIVLLKDYQSSS